MERAVALVVLGSSHCVVSRWVMWEIDLAQVRGLPVFTWERPRGAPLDELARAVAEVTMPERQDSPSAFRPRAAMRGWRRCRILPS